MGACCASLASDDGPTSAQNASVTGMSRSLRDQRTVELADRLVIERLPVGYAHGMWRVRLVLSGPEAVRDRDDGSMSLLREVEEILAVEGVGGPLQHRDSSLYGGHDEVDLMWSFVGDDITGMRFTYRHDGNVVATEVVDLSE